MTTITDTAASLDAAYLADWAGWRARRLRAATEAYGIAAGVGTDWLDETPRTLPAVPGSWRLEGDVVVGEGLDADAAAYAVTDFETPLDHGGTLRIPLGASVQFGSLRLVGFRRVDDRGLRTYDPTSPARTTLLDIAAWAPDPAFRVTARFEPEADGATVYTDQTDGGRVRRTHLGTAVFELAGRTHRISVVNHHTQPGRGFASFSDALSGVETYRFRFLDIDLPAEGSDEIVLDFNRAYLPPASFHPSYSCPLPLGDRLDVEIRAGERRQVRAS